MTYRPSAYCLDCEEHEYLYLVDCCNRHSPGCAIIERRDLDGKVDVRECRAGNGCQRGR